MSSSTSTHHPLASAPSPVLAASSPSSSSSAASPKAKPKKPLTWQHMVAGSIAGMSAKTLLQPMDLIKIRLQVQDGRVKEKEYRGILDAAYRIVRSEGFFGLYRGLQANLLGSAISWGTYFFTYNQFKTAWRKTFMAGQSQQQPLSPLAHLATAAAGTGCAMIVTNPVTMVKTRLQLQGREVDHSSATQYRGIYDAFRRIVREEGPFAFYRGLAPSLLLVVNGALQFMFYEELKIGTARLLHVSQDQLMTEHSFWMGGAAKLFSATITYPLQLSRSRLYQKGDSDAKPLKATASMEGGVMKLASANAALATGDAVFKGPRNSKVGAKYSGLGDVLSKTVRYEGVLGLYRGLYAHLLKTAPSSAITMFVYETVTKMFTKAQAASKSD